MLHFTGSAIAYDTETTGLYPHQGDEMFAWSTCDQEGKIEVIRFDRDREEALRRLADLWLGSGCGITKIMHNAKFDLAMTEKALGCRLAETSAFEDTIIMSHMLRSDHPGHSLKDLAWELAGIPKDDEKAIKAYLRGGKQDYSLVPEELMDPYQRRDARRTMLLYLFFRKKLLREPKLLSCYEWEKKAIIPTMRLEARGFMIDRERCEELADAMEIDAKEALDEVEKEYGRRINIGTDAVIRQVFFMERRYPIISRTESGLPSVTKEVLEKLYAEHRDPLLRLAIRYKARRRGAKILRGYLECADQTGILHPSIHTLGAGKTGRESSSNPNLQNVEKERKLTNLFPVPARKAFRPRPGFINFHADYKGIELRLLVHYSKDPELVAEVAKPDGDPHLLAARIFYPPWDDSERNEFRQFVIDHPEIVAGIDAFPVKSEEWDGLRDPAKNTNFAVPYGAGWQKASTTLGLPLEIGQKRFEEYRKRFPNLCNMTRNIVSIVKEKGGVETQLGRFLHVPRDKAYMGVNYLIQGTAAEILKRSQVRVHEYLERKTKGACGIILPIHDELVIEWPRKMLAEAPAHWREIRAIMIDFPQFNVPLEISVDASTTDWSQKEPYSFMKESA
jgi:DNA polymerase-1